MNWDPPDSSPPSLWQNGVCDELALPQFITGGAHPPPKLALLSPLPLGGRVRVLRPQNSRLRCEIPRSHVGNCHASQEFGKSSSRFSQHPPFSPPRRKILFASGTKTSSPHRDSNQIGKEPFAQGEASASITQLRRALANDTSVHYNGQ